MSYHRHIRKHRQETTRTFMTEGGEEAGFRDLSHFLRAAGIDGYIKQYWTYHFMRAKAPDHLLLLPYEALVDSPAAAFERMIDFFDLEVDRAKLERVFPKALNATTPQSLRNLEKAIGSSLGRDQADAGESHLRGGEVGKWKGVLSEEDRRYVEERLRLFGLDLAEMLSHGSGRGD